MKTRSITSDASATDTSNGPCSAMDVTELKWFKKASLNELEKKLSDHYCKSGTVGKNFLNGVIKLANKGGRKAMSCEDYALFHAETKITSYKGSGKVPKPSCQMSAHGKSDWAKTEIFFNRVQKQFA